MHSHARWLAQAKAGDSSTVPFALTCRKDPGCAVRYANDQAISYVFGPANDAEAMQAKVLTEDRARLMPALLRHGE
jgi:hypothetical protein